MLRGFVRLPPTRIFNSFGYRRFSSIFTAYFSTFTYKPLEIKINIHHFIKTTSFLGKRMQSYIPPQQPDYILQMTEGNFQKTLDGSFEKPTLLFFWASSIQESIETLTHVEKITLEYEGAFVLALVDCEKEQLIASQFGLSSLPSMALFDKGQPANFLEGPQSEASIRQFLAPFLPSIDEIAFQKISLLLLNKEYETALVSLKKLDLSFAQTGKYKLALAECYVETQQFEAAKTLLETVLMQDQDALYNSLIAKIELHTQAADTPEIRELQMALEASPENQSLAYDLAIQFSQVHRQEEALELLLQLLRKDLHFSDGNAKKTMMDILSTLGQGNEVASRYRRQLYSLLY